MKTFTNCATKAKQFFNLLQGYTKGIRITAILILLLMGVSNTWADIAFSGGYIYFDNSIGINQTYIQLCARQSSWTGVSTLSKINNTKLYYVANPQGSGWGGILGWVVIGNSSQKSNSNFDNWSTYGWCSNWNTYGFNSGSTYLIVPSSTSKSQSVTTSHHSGGYSALNSTQTIKTAVNGADANSKATITVTSYKLTGNGAISTQQSASFSTSAKSTTISAARTATTTLTVGSVATGYQFDGWYTAATGGTQLSTSTTHTYYPTAATTVYARFSAEKYTITYKDQGGSNFSGTHESGYPTTHTYGTATTLKGATKTGNTFGGWFDNKECTGTAIESLGATAYTANITLYAKWTAIEETKYDVTISANANGSVDPSGPQKVGTSGIQVTAMPNPGYELSEWTVTGGATVSSKDATTTLTATDDGTLTATFRAKTYTITLGVQGGTGGTNSVTVTYNDDNYSVSPVIVPTRTGYTFGGYYSGTSCTGKQVVDESGEWVKGTTGYTDANGNWINTSAGTLYACWKEKSHDVTIRYLSGTTSIKEQTIEYGVGEVTTQSITAPEIDGYVFTEWTLGDGINNKSANNTTNPISITTKAEGTYMLTANYQKTECVYFINTGRWTKVQIYAWLNSNNQDKNAEWPGEAMEKLNETINGYEVYRYIRPVDKNYDKLVFNQGNDDGKTSDLDWEDGKYYVYSAGQWVEREHVEDYLPNPVIYFKNHIGWEKVYVYFCTENNWGDNGASASGLTVDNKRVCEMEKVGDTDIYKYDYKESGIVPGNVIAFTKDNQANYGNFWQTEAAYRSDYNPSMELYIPQKTSNETKNSTKYYNKGLWMKYNSTESGYSITGSLNNWDHNSDKFTADAPGVYHFEVAMLLDGGKDYNLKIKNIKNDWFSTSTALASTQNTDIEFAIEHSGDAKITTTSDGYYIFSIDLSEGKMNVSVEYPVHEGDYRMVYIESETAQTAPFTKFHPAQSIRGIAEGQRFDTVSFYINKSVGQNHAILLQKCTAINGSNITWVNQSFDDCATITDSENDRGVYNFVLYQKNGSAQILPTATHPYKGDYYIRTDGAKGGWRKYLTNRDNIMTHSETALTHGGYDYYFCAWMLSGQNVKYVVANDYNYCLSDTLDTDDIVNNQYGAFLESDANVRYTWNSKTNHVERAYINGSGKAGDRYLVLIGNDKLQDASGKTFPEGTGDRTGLKANETTFADMGNWLYQVDVKASAATQVKLTANYNGIIQYFKGGENETVPIVSGGEKHYKFRLIYDFKTNYLLCGLIEDGEITEQIQVDEAMISRAHHENAQTFDVKQDAHIKTVKTVYGVMKFNKTTLNDSEKSQYERALYWVSFPFDVDLGKAFGFGNYGEHWIMEYYDGKERAEKGLWVDSGTYWKYITNPKGYILQAGVGYVLCLDLALLHEDAAIFNYSDEIALYFPSYNVDPITKENVPITINANPSHKEITVPEWKCKIERDDRKTKDSNWNIVGVPAYTNYPDIDQKDLGFYYEYIADNNKYKVNTAAVFNCMHAYMVQFAGKIIWAENRVEPSQIAARRNAADKDQYTLRLALQQEGKDQDHTFVRLQEENVTAEFDMNYDLCKIFNRGANIYSLIGNIEVAANVLPIAEYTIPLGLDIATEGEYTFRMPDGTEGMVVELLDYEENTRTNLLLSDYTVTLQKGSNENRFALYIQPSKSGVSTSVENIDEGVNGGEAVMKYLIDGRLYLKKGSVLYDAQGRKL